MSASSPHAVATSGGDSRREPAAANTDAAGTTSSRLPLRTVVQTGAYPLPDTSGAASTFPLPLPKGVTTFYPQSLWQEQVEGKTDNDVLTQRTTYHLRASERLEIGKYVPDPNNEDFSNPKYRAPENGAGPKRSPLLFPIASYGRTSLAATSQPDANAKRTTSRPRYARFPAPPSQPRPSASAGKSHDSDDFSTEPSSGNSSRSSSVVGGATEPRGSAASANPDRRRSSVRTTCPVVVPRYSVSSASLFFPVHYGRPSQRDLNDPRGLPQQINETLHPNDRSDMPLSSLSLQRGNLARMCLYKIGPGAVCFRVVTSAFEAAGMQYTPSNELFTILWAKRATPHTLASLHPYQKVNHFPGTWGVGRKDSLAQNMYKMRRYFGDEAFDIVPTSFLIPRQKTELELDAQRHPDTAENPLVYIVKPSASSCGRGIQLYRGLPPMPRGTKQMVCQRYIGNPLLVFGRKFDLRMYCVVTSFDPLRIYLFDEGLVRFAAEKYKGPDKDIDNIHVHLTNYSVNKTAELSRESRGKAADGDEAVDIKWCISDLKQHLAKKHPLGAAAWDKIQAGCDDVVVKSFLSIEAEVIDRIRNECRDPTGRNCFEFFGLDLMVDDTLKVRLIEANIMPSLATGSTLDKAVKSRMLAHMLTMVRAIPVNRQTLQDEALYRPKGAAASRPERMYEFGKHPNASALIMKRPLLRQFNDSNDPDSVLSTEETLMLLEAEEELHCAGSFRRVFPSADTVQRYLPLFTHGVRRNNYLLASSVLQQRKKLG